MGSMTSLGMHVPMGREARQPWVRAALFAAALALSALLHGALLVGLPQIGRASCRERV